MSKLRVHISMSLDGYVAGRNQGSDDPSMSSTRARNQPRRRGRPDGVPVAAWMPSSAKVW
jgi:hypothetical protein